MKKQLLEDKLIEAFRNKGFIPAACVRYAQAITNMLPTSNGDETEDIELVRSELYDIADALQVVGINLKNI